MRISLLGLTCLPEPRVEDRFCFGLGPWECGRTRPPLSASIFSPPRKNFGQSWKKLWRRLELPGNTPESSWSISAVKQDLILRRGAGMSNKGWTKASMYKLNMRNIRAWTKVWAKTSEESKLPPRLVLDILILQSYYCINPDWID